MISLTSMPSTAPVSSCRLLCNKFPADVTRVIRIVLCTCSSKREEFSCFTVMIWGSRVSRGRVGVKVSNRIWVSFQSYGGNRTSRHGVSGVICWVPDV